MTKEQLRKQTKSKITNLSNSDKQQKSRIIRNILRSEIAKQKVTSVCCYLSTDLEVDTWEFIDYLLDRGIEVYIPDHTDRKAGTVWKIHAQTTFATDRLGLKFPRKNYEKITGLTSFDWVICPMLGFDNNKNRLGRGWGFYDRFLEKARGLKLGLAFEESELTRIPIERHDIPMDSIFIA